jgi:two-component system NtrC family sensor kinase
MDKTADNHAAAGNQGLSLNLAIVGGGRACKFFLDRLAHEALAHLSIQIIGVCDVNSQAEGMKEARNRGIYTTDNFHDLFSLDGLDGILELTNIREVLVELVKHRPKGVGILEHNIGRFIRDLFLTEARLQSTQAQLLHEKEISDFLIQQAKQWILVLNPDFTIADCNQAYLDAAGQSRSAVIGRRCHEVMRGLKSPCASAFASQECPLVETLRIGKPVSMVHDGTAEDSLPCYTEISTCPVKDSDGHVVQVIEIWRDISATLAPRWERRVEELKSDLNRLVQEDRMISLGKLVASCVHEINNPIQGLLTFSFLMSDTLKQSPLDHTAIDQLKQMATLMGEELERCGRIVSGLLSFSRESPMAYGETDLNEVLDSVLGLTRHKMALQEIELDLDLQAENPRINGDKNLLQQCFLNLIFNAMEAMPDGGRLQIRSRPDDEDRSICIKVADTGGGIPDDHFDRLFDPFFSTKPSGEGTGLGLSIVYGVVINHGGRINVRNRVNGGASFELCFPGQPLDLPDSEPEKP